MLKLFFFYSGEIFSNVTLKLENISIREVVSAFYGRCYAVEGQAPLPFDDSLILDLNASMNYKVFVHNKGEEIWISGTAYFPTETIIFTLGKPKALCDN